MSEAERQRKMAQALEAKRIEMERAATSAPSVVTTQASKQAPAAKQPADVPSVSDVEVAAARRKALIDQQRELTQIARKASESIHQPTTDGDLPTSTEPPGTPATDRDVEAIFGAGDAMLNAHVANVFAEVRTEVVRPTDQQKRRRKRDRTGGGRQPQRKRLDARKETEFRFGLRRLLYDESRSIDEVHCSNIEGQVWSRGSRQSVEAAVEYVNEKAEDAIIPEDLRDEIARLIREFTTRR